MHAKRAKPAGPEVTIWTGPTRCALIGRLLDVLGRDVTPIGVGGPRATAVTDLATSLSCPCEDDLRKLIVENPAAFLLLGDHDGVSTDDLHAATAAGTTILTLEPVADDFDMLDQVEPILGSLHLLPAFSQSPGSLASANPAEALEERRTVAFNSVGSEASLYTRLWDAWTTALAYLPTPESIDAALTTAEGGVPQQLGQLKGRLTAHGRYVEAGSVVLALSDTTGTERRGLHVIADNAELRATDAVYELYQNDGTLLDHAESKGPATWADLIAHHWLRLLDRPPAPADLPTVQSVLACCLATLLSARTGQPERPGDVLRMHVS